jgi:phosphoserine phosphatase
MKKGFAFDFDDTLVKTDCKILVVKDGGVIKRLSTDEFHSYSLEHGEQFDFHEFNQVINPVKLHTVELAKQVAEENHDVFIITARSEKSRESILRWLESENLQVTKIYCVGDKNKSIAEEKSSVLIELMGALDKIYFYDDNHDNVNEAKKNGIKSYKI